jgi:hypothetical protein
LKVNAFTFKIVSEITPYPVQKRVKSIKARAEGFFWASLLSWRVEKKKTFARSWIKGPEPARFIHMIERITKAWAEK